MLVNCIVRQLFPCFAINAALPGCQVSAAPVPNARFVASDLIWEFFAAHGR